MSQLDTKKVTSLACGPNFILALGQTLKPGQVGTQNSSPTSVIDDCDNSRSASRSISAEREKPKKACRRRNTARRSGSNPSDQNCCGGHD